MPKRKPLDGSRPIFRNGTLLDQHTLNWVYKVLRRNGTEGVVGLIRECAKTEQDAARKASLKP